MCFRIQNLAVIILDSLIQVWLLIRVDFILDKEKMRFLLICNKLCRSARWNLGLDPLKPHDALLLFSLSPK